MFCECADPGCASHKGQACAMRAKGVLFRVDMGDTMGVAFCVCCLDDALDSGVFTSDTSREVKAKIARTRKARR